MWSKQRKSTIISVMDKHDMKVKRKSSMKQIEESVCKPKIGLTVGYTEQNNDTAASRLSKKPVTEKRDSRSSRVKHVSVSSTSIATSLLGDGKKNPLKKAFDDVKDDFDSLPLDKLFKILISRGICPNEDPRLIDIRRELENTYKGRRLTDIVLNFEYFRQVCEPVAPFITRVLENKLAINRVDEWVRCLSLYYEGIKTMTGKDMAVSLASTDGQRLRWGHTRRTFPINELLHVITYCMASETLGFTTLHQTVGLEVRPSSEWEPGNPLIGAGALAVVANLLHHYLGRMDPTERHESVRNLIKDLSGGFDVQFDSRTFVSSERKGEYLKAVLAWIIGDERIDSICKDVEKVVQFYMECSSLQIDVEALSVLGATLANGGVCATTGIKILCCECVESVLSVMAISSGKPGVPIMASSSGAVLIIVPGIFSLGIHSEDPAATSYFISALFRHFALNPFEQKFIHIEKPHKKSASLEPCLFYSAKTGDIMTLSSILDKGVNLTARDYMSRTVLHTAIAHGHLPYISFILKYCPTLINCTDMMGISPLEEARYFKRKEIEELLESCVVLSQDQFDDSRSLHSSTSKSND